MLAAKKYWITSFSFSLHNCFLWACHSLECWWSTPVHVADPCPTQDCKAPNPSDQKHYFWQDPGAAVPYSHLYSWRLTNNLAVTLCCSFSIHRGRCSQLLFRKGARASRRTQEDRGNQAKELINKASLGLPSQDAILNGTPLTDLIPDVCCLFLVWLFYRLNLI